MMCDQSNLYHHNLYCHHSHCPLCLYKMSSHRAAAHHSLPDKNICLPQCHNFRHRKKELNRRITHS